MHRDELIKQYSTHCTTIIMHGMPAKVELNRNNHPVHVSFSQRQKLECVKALMRMFGARFDTFCPKQQSNVTRMCCGLTRALRIVFSDDEGTFCDASASTVTHVVLAGGGGEGKHAVKCGGTVVLHGGPAGTVSRATNYSDQKAN
jgi:hypothetical protein